MTPAELIAQKSCCGACMTAVTGDHRCKCKCRGATHGLMARADISSLMSGRAIGLHRLTDLEVLTG